MKKTVTTILSLALAIIMVSSLSSGVILAKGDDDHDNRKKNKNKYHTVHDVAILDCTSEAFFGAPLIFSAFNGPDDIMLPAEDGCAANLAFLLNIGFGKQDVGLVSVNAGGTSIALMSRHTLVRKRREKIED